MNEFVAVTYLVIAKILGPLSQRCRAGRGRCHRVPPQRKDHQRQAQQSAIDYNVFEGIEVTGLPRFTLDSRKLAVTEGKVSAEPGHGQFVGRKPNGAVSRALSQWKDIIGLRAVSCAPVSRRRGDAGHRGSHRNVFAISASRRASWPFDGASTACRRLPPLLHRRIPHDDVALLTLTASPPTPPVALNFVAIVGPVFSSPPRAPPKARRAAPPTSCGSQITAPAAMASSSKALRMGPYPACPPAEPAPSGALA